MKNIIINFQIKQDNKKFFILVFWPFHNLTHPPEHNLHNVHNFYVDVEPGVKVGVWHYIPDSSSNYNHAQHSKVSINKHLKKYIGKNDEHIPVMIYVHGI